MVLVKTAPYGEWKSVIGVEAATAKRRMLASPRVCAETRRTFFLGSRIDSTNGIIEVTNDGLIHVLPGHYSVSTWQEHEGHAYALVSGEELRIVFSDAQRGSLNVLHVDTGAVEDLQESCTLRYADFDCYPGMVCGTQDVSWVLAVEEDHETLESVGIVNRVVAINLVTKQIVPLAQGAGFYSSPCFSPDGRQLAWLQGSQAQQLSHRAQLYLAAFDPEDASISDIRAVAGDDQDSIAEPRWSPEGDLFFTSDKSGFRQLSRIHNGLHDRISLPGLEAANFGDPSRAAGCISYVFLSDDLLLATAFPSAPPSAPQLVYIDLLSQDCSLLSLPEPLVHLARDGLAAMTPDAFLAISASHTTPPALHHVSIFDDLSAEMTVIASSATNHDAARDPWISVPHPLRFTTLREPRREVGGMFYPPRNPRYVAPPGEAPPVVISASRGKDKGEGEGLDMRVQYLTSRGVAYFALDGEAGEDDVSEAVEFLGWSGRVDRGRVVVEGQAWELGGLKEADAGGLAWFRERKLGTEEVVAGEIQAC